MSEHNDPTAQHERAGVSRVVVNIAIAGTVLLGLAAAVLSFTALTDLAVRAGVPHGLGFVWPIIVDGLIVVSTIAVFAAAGPAQRGVRNYAWSLLGLGAAVSVLANGAHAIVAAPAETPRVMAVAVASVPPIVLLAVTHLTALLARKQHPTQADLAATPAAVTAADSASNPEPDHDPDKAALPESEPERESERIEAWLDPSWTPPAASEPARELVPATASALTTPQPAKPATTLDQATLEAAPALTEPVTAPTPTAPAPSPAPVVAEPVAPPGPRTAGARAAEPGDLSEWIATRVHAGQSVTGKAAHEAGLVGSVRTGTRRIAALREEDPDLFSPRVLRALPAQIGA